MIGTVNALPPCDTYVMAIYRSVQEMYPEGAHGTAQRTDDGRIFIKVDGTMLEFEVAGKKVNYIGLKDAEMGSMGDIGEEVGFGFNPQPGNQQPSAASSDSSAFPDMPSLDADSANGAPSSSSASSSQSGSTASSSPSSSSEESSQNPFDPELNLIVDTGGDKENIEKQIKKFFSKLDVPGQLSLRRFLDTRPVWVKIDKVDSKQMTGTIRGVVYTYDIIIYPDGSISIPDAAWSEYPQWNAFKHVEQ